MPIRLVLQIPIATGLRDTKFNLENVFNIFCDARHLLPEINSSALKKKNFNFRKNLRDSKIRRARENKLVGSPPGRRGEKFKRRGEKQQQQQHPRVGP